MEFFNMYKITASIRNPLHSLDFAKQGTVECICYYAAHPLSK